MHSRGDLDFGSRIADCGLWNDVRCVMWDKESTLKSHISYLTSLLDSMLDKDLHFTAYRLPVNKQLMSDFYDFHYLTN